MDANNYGFRMICLLNSGGRTCKDCKWRSDEFTSACENDRSPHCADFVDADWICPAFEGKDEHESDG